VVNLQKSGDGLGDPALAADPMRDHSEASSLNNPFINLELKQEVREMAKKAKKAKKEWEEPEEESKEEWQMRWGRKVSVKNNPLIFF
jgi:hypothetical protein